MNHDLINQTTVSRLNISSAGTMGDGFYDARTQHIKLGECNRTRTKAAGVQASGGTAAGPAA